jgi:antitoxin HigA-1
MNRLNNVHPGEIMEEEFLKPLGITSYKLSQAIRVPQTRTSQILKGRRRITADTALRLAKFFGPSSKFWLNLQNDFDIEEEMQTITKELKQIPTVV